MPTAWKTRPTWPVTAVRVVMRLPALSMVASCRRSRSRSRSAHSTVRPAAVSQLLLQHQRQERAEDMATDGGIGGMIDRPGAQDRLGAAEQVLDLQQIAVAKHRLQRGEA